MSIRDCGTIAFHDFVHILLRQHRPSILHPLLYLYVLALLVCLLLQYQLISVTFCFAAEIECWADTMSLHYDDTVGYSANAPGVDVRVPGWGDVHTIEYIDPSMTAWILGAGNYMKDFIHGKTD